MSIARQILAVVGTTGVLVACALGGLQVAFAGQRETGAMSSESVKSPPKVAPEPLSTSATSPITSRGASAEADLPHYDASSDISLIVYPDSLDPVELANAREWVETESASAVCMRDKGFDYTFVLWWDRPLSQNGEGLPSSDEKYGSPEFEALYGDPYASNYDPVNGAGCRGQVLATRDK